MTEALLTQTAPALTVDGRLRAELSPDLVRLEVEAGMLVTQVLWDSIAHQAGMQIGDVIVGVGRFPIQTLEDFALLLDWLAEGEHEVKRSGSSFFGGVTLRWERPRPPERDHGGNGGNGGGSGQGQVTTASCLHLVQLRSIQLRWRP